ncbi:hypothetical protein [Streptomyces sp. NPDC050534]|uniref:hypothetical protein n=1 Tax=Streptomyces sp. NPDC050534 TaxID=3365625 RepID=UPI00378E3729
MADQQGKTDPMLLDSQEAALEPLEPDEKGASLDVGPTPDVIAETAVRLLPRA